MGTTASNHYAPLPVESAHTSNNNSTSTHLSSESHTPSSSNQSTITTAQQNSNTCAQLSHFSNHSHNNDNPQPPPTCYHPLPKHESDSTSPDADTSDETPLVPTMFTWKFGGNDVYVSGAWDNWHTKTQMSKLLQDHIALIYLPCGQYHFKYYVDRNWQCAPNLPTATDRNGNNNNLITVADVEPEFDVSTPLHDISPPSPISSYDNSSNTIFNNDPPQLPAFLAERSLKSLPEDISPKAAATSNHQQHSPHLPSQPCSHRSCRPFFTHVSVDHLYAVRSSSSHTVRSFSHTARHYDKVINTIFVASAPASNQNSEPFSKPPPH